MRRVAIVLAVALPLAALGYTAAMARWGGGPVPPAMATPQDRADAVRVVKSARRLDLLRGGSVIASYEVSLGAEPAGAKAREGDERTPEGRYRIDWRNPRSRDYLSLHISYPDAGDSARAAAKGDDPGGDIMIHGIANGWGFLGRLHRAWDWTDGCIAVTNREMSEIWSRVPDGTPITIEG